MLIRSRSAVLAGALFAVAVAEVVTTVVAGTESGIGARALLNGFAISNAVIGLSLAAAGWPIAWRRPENPIGWLLAAAGICYATSAAGYAVLALGSQPGDDAPGWRLLATVTNGGWTWAISVLLPICILIFPDGHLPGRRWRWIVILAAVNSLMLFTMAVITRDTVSSTLGVTGYLTDTNLEPVGWIGAIEAVVATVIVGGALAGLITHYRRGDDRIRRQLLWLVLAVLIQLTAATVENLLDVDSWVSIFLVAMLPLAILVAILRHQLLDIRLVVSRSVLYLLLTGVVVTAYIGLVSALDSVLRQQIGLGSSVIATLLIAGAFNPVRLWLQRRIDRFFYGARSDPVRAMTEVGTRIGEVSSATGVGLNGVLEVLCQVMRLPSASIVASGREIAGYGDAPELRQSVPLHQGGESLSELTVGLRTGESRLDPADERVIRLLSAPLAVALHATSLAAELARAREALVTAREEERRRLRRDLHDGLGPALTGVVLKADAARRLAGPEPNQVRTLLAELRLQTTAAIDDIRRLVNELRPPALDGLGLVDALRAQADLLSRRVDGAPLRVEVSAAGPLASLPAAAEVAAYRIVTEALANVTRHSTASTASVGLHLDGTRLSITIHDNGRDSQQWRPGVGLVSMNERAAELGGDCSAGPGPDGGRVVVTIPVGGGG